jgi:hypothetical protein
MTHREAMQAVKWFKKNVGLSDWSVKVFIGEPSKELDGDLCGNEKNNYCGRCVHWPQFRRAEIWVNPAAHDAPHLGTEAATLFHELLHCFHASCNIDDENGLAEYGVNRIAGVLEQAYIA